MQSNLWDLLSFFAMRCQTTQNCMKSRRNTALPLLLSIKKQEETRAAPQILVSSASNPENFQQFAERLLIVF